MSKASKIISPTKEELQDHSGVTAVLPKFKDTTDPYPTVDPGRRPLTYMVLVQLRYVRKVKDLGGGKQLFMTDTHRDVQRYTTDVAKVVGIGPMAWHNHQTGEPIPGVTRDAPKIGDLVQVPSVGGKSYWVAFDGEDEGIEFNYLRDVDIIGAVTDPDLKTVMGA